MPPKGTRRGYRTVTYELPIHEYEMLETWAEAETRTPSQQTAWAMKEALIQYARHEAIANGVVGSEYPLDGEEPDANHYVAAGERS